MRYLARMWPVAKAALGALVVWLALAGAVLAQMPAQNKPAADTAGGGLWVFAYFVVILGIAAGLLFVCRSGGRRDRARPEQYGEAKIAILEETKK
jgi:hypothetical protein